MPELPEVETVKRGLALALDLPAFITSVRLLNPAMRIPAASDFQDKLNNSIVKTITRRGKYILLFLEKEGGQAGMLVIHLGMSGKLSLIPSALQDYKPEKHDHVLLGLSETSTMVFNDQRRFGYLAHYPFTSETEFAAFKNLGPEPLCPGFTPDTLTGALSGRTGPIKTVLLNQEIIAGLGNIYVCEALYEAGISPRRKALTVKGRRAAALCGSIKSVLNRAITAGGSTLRNYRSLSGEAGYFQTSFSVYDREGMACPSCSCGARSDMKLLDKGIKRIVQSGRSTYYCSIKQR